MSNMSPAAQRKQEAIANGFNPLTDEERETLIHERKVQTLKNKLGLELAVKMSAKQKSSEEISSLLMDLNDLVDLILKRNEAIFNEKVKDLLPRYQMPGTTKAPLPDAF